MKATFLIVALMSGFLCTSVLRAQQTATPVFSITSETFTTSLSTTITDSTSGASIEWCYIASGTCTPGSTGTSSSYTGAIFVNPSTSETVCADATASPDTVSSISCQSYTNASATKTATPAFSLASGTFTGSTSTTITDSASGAPILYCTVASGNCIPNTPYTGSITISSTEMICASAMASGDAVSTSACNTYTSSAAATTATPVFSLPPGTFSASTSTTITDSTSGASIYYCTVASGNCSPGTAYSVAIPISSTETICANATLTGDNPSTLICNTYTISASQPGQITGSGSSGTVPVFTGTSAVGNSPITISGSNVGIGTTTPPTLPLTVISTSGSASFTELGILHAASTAPALTVTTGSNNAAYGAGTAISAISKASDWGGNQLGVALYAAAPYDGTNASGFTYADTTVGLYVDNLYSYAGKNSTATYGIFAAGGQWNYFAGSVGIGTPNPGYSLDVVGVVRARSGVIYPDGNTQTTAWTGVLCGGDYAESVDVSGDRTHYGPGDVLVIDPDEPGKFLKSAEPYSTAVLGVYSTKPGVLGRRQAEPKSLDEVPMAMVGIVPTNVSAENGAIRPGDLLVTASTPGYAMKGTDRGRMLGAIVGKAMASLDSGTGVIEVGVTLQ